MSLKTLLQRKSSESSNLDGCRKRFSCFLQPSADLVAENVFHVFCNTANAVQKT